ncbi:MAG: BatD family protein, partial [Polyangiales bacterium]
MRALPPEARAAGAVVGDFQVQARLHPKRVRVGEAATLTLHVRGPGQLRGLQLPAPQPPGVRVLAPEVRDTVRVDAGVLRSHRRITWVLLPQKPGRHAIEPMSVASFVPNASGDDGRLVRRRTPALSLEARGAAVARPSRTVSQQAWPPLLVTPTAVIPSWWQSPMLWWGLTALWLALGLWLWYSASGRRPSRPRQVAPASDWAPVRAELLTLAATGDVPAFVARAAALWRSWLSPYLSSAELRALTAAEVEARLQAQGVAPMLSQAVSQMQVALESARFAPDAWPPAELEARAHAVVQLGQQLSEAGRAEASRPAAVHRSAGLAALLVCAFGASMGAAGPTALAADSLQRRFAQAGRAYAAGDYAAALQQYRSVLRLQPSAAVHHNLALSYARLGQRGPARYHLHR